MSNTKRPVVQLNKDTGEVIAIFPAPKPASVALNIGLTSIIACVNGRLKTAGGFKFKYEDLKPKAKTKKELHTEKVVLDQEKELKDYLEGALRRMREQE